MTKNGIMKKYASMLSKIDERDLRLYDVVSSAMAKWMLSRPTKIFQTLVDERKKDVLAQCGTDGIQFGIQIRTWRDDEYGHGQMYEVVFDDIISCINSWLGSGVRAMNSRSKYCVYITSDDPEETKHLVNKLRDVDDRLTFVTAVPPSDDSWHTEESFKVNKTNFDPQHLLKHNELIDWYIFGEADASIYSLRSSFGRTARMRRGYEGQNNDYIVGRENMGLQFMCTSVRDYNLSSGWSGYGTLRFNKKTNLKR